MKKDILCYMIIISIFSCNVYAQNSVATAPNKINDKNINVVDPLKTYERVIEKGYKSIDLLKKIGNAYYFKEELNKSAKWYGELFALTSELEPVYYFRYSQSLRSIGENDKATEMMEKFNKILELTTEDKK